MPSLNVLKNVNLAIERRGGTSCPNPSLNPSASCGTNTLPYTALSFDEAAQKWYPANDFGFYTSSVNTAGTITGSAYLVNVSQNGCPYPAVYFSGSATFPLAQTNLYLGIVTGSFTISGDEGGAGGAWYIVSSYINTGSVDLRIGTGGGSQTYHYDTMTTKNSLVGFALGNFVAPFNPREVFLSVSGSIFAVNPPVTSYNFPSNLGSTFTLSGVGIIRSFGYTSGSLTQQTQYNCLYGSTPSK